MKDKKQEKPQKPVVIVKVKMFFILSNGIICDNFQEAIETKNSK